MMIITLEKVLSHALQRDIYSARLSDGPETMVLISSFNKKIVLDYFSQFRHAFLVKYRDETIDHPQEE